MGTPAGDVTILDQTGAEVGSGTLDGSGDASISVTAYNVGVGNFIVSYGGNANFNGNEAAAAETVVQAASAITTLTSPGTLVFGQTANFPVSVSAASGLGTPSGTVTISDQNNTVVGTGTLDSSGDASVAVTIASGTYTANYLGDASFAGTSATVAQTVNQANTVVSISSPGTISLGQSGYFPVTVSAQSPGSGIPTTAP